MKEFNQTRGIMRGFKCFLLVVCISLVAQNISFADNQMGLTDTQIIKEAKKLDKKISKNPENARLYLKRGFYRFLLKDYGSALEDYNKAEELTPNNADIFYSRGRVWYERKNYISALEDFNKAIELNPKDSKLYVSRGLTKDAQDNLNGAINDYNSAIEYNQRNRSAYINRGIARSKQGKDAGAIADFKKAVKLSKRYSPDAYYNMGLVKCKQGKYEEGVEEFTKAIEQNPKYSQAYHQRGLAYLKLDNQQFAKADFEMAYQLSPANKKAKEDLDNVKKYLNDLLKEEEILY